MRGYGTVKMDYTASQTNGDDRTHFVQAKCGARRIRDYARVGQALSLQRVVIYSSAVLLSGFYYDYVIALWFFAAVVACEIYDAILLRYILRQDKQRPTNLRRAMLHVYIITFLSSVAIALFCVAIAIQQGTNGNHFLPLFLLVSASIFAAMNTHQFIPVLCLRLVIYVSAILFIPLRDVWVVRPPLSSEVWLNLFTVTFVLGFLIELARNFIQGYTAMLKNQRELQIEHKHALAASEAKTRFLATVSHELRTPLTSIKGALDILNSGAVSPLPENVTRLLEMAGRNSNRLNDLVVDLLLLQTSDAGMFSLDIERIDIADVARGAIDTFDGYANKLGINVTSDIPQGQFFVDGDTKRLDQVVTNLLSNAAKFSDAGDVVHVALSEQKGSLVLTVKDQGIGIPAGSEQKVFEEFGQIDNSDQRKFQGTGLGLAISKRIMKAHGGEITYTSVLGEGTEFRISLKASNAIRPSATRLISADELAA